MPTSFTEKLFVAISSIPGHRKMEQLRFEVTDGLPLALASLWEHWKRPETGEMIESFTIITTSANDFMTPNHGRMPVILNDAEMDLWIDPEESNLLLLEEMLRSNQWNRQSKVKIFPIQLIGKCIAISST